MYNYFVWDKKSSINNCDADEILKSEPFCKMNKIVFFTHNEKPFVHADTDELRKELQIPFSESDEYVYETYIKILEEKENESQQEQTNLEKMQDKISILEAENKKLKEEQEQQNEEILINMLAITEMYEFSRSFAVSTVESSSRSKVPTYIQATYQKLYELKAKTIEEIPFEVRENIKNI